MLVGIARIGWETLEEVFIEGEELERTQMKNETIRTSKKKSTREGLRIGEEVRLGSKGSKEGLE